MGHEGVEDFDVEGELDEPDPGGLQVQRLRTAVDVTVRVKPRTIGAFQYSTAISRKSQSGV